MSKIFKNDAFARFSGFHLKFWPTNPAAFGLGDKGFRGQAGPGQPQTAAWTPSDPLTIYQPDRLDPPPLGPQDTRLLPGISHHPRFTVDAPANTDAHTTRSTCLHTGGGWPCLGPNGTTLGPYFAAACTAGVLDCECNQGLRVQAIPFQRSGSAAFSEMGIWASVLLPPGSVLPQKLSSPL